MAIHRSTTGIKRRIGKREKEKGGKKKKRGTGQKDAMTNI